MAFPPLSHALLSIIGPFSLPFVQRGALEILLLAVAGGVVGTWIVLRGIAFFAHAVGTAAFPGLVLADGLRFPAHLGAGVTAALVAAVVGVLTRRDRSRYDVATALVLVGALAVGVVLASDVFRSGSSIDTLLFGSLLAIAPTDLIWTAAAAVLVLVGTWLLGRRWLATGFDPASARALGVVSPLPDLLLLALVALVAIAALSTVGALLATSVTVVPAATTRLVLDRMGRWQLATVVLAAVQGLAGLWVSYAFDVPPGPAIAVLSGVAFLLVALLRLVRVRRPSTRPAPVPA